MSRSSIRLVLAAAIVSSFVFQASISTAGPVCLPRIPAGVDLPCEEDPKTPPCSEQRPVEQEKGPLCAQGPAECIAVGLGIYVDPTIALPGGASTELSRSHAQSFAQGYGGFGFGHASSDTAVQRASVPPALGEGVVESSCSVRSYAQEIFAFNGADGTAETARLRLDLTSYGAPIGIVADILREDGSSSTGGAGGNTANVADVTVTAPGGPYVISHSEAPNQAYPLPGGLGTVYFNEQFAAPTPFGCVGHHGDAMRVALNRPVLGGTITVLVSWVSTAAC